MLFKSKHQYNRLVRGSSLREVPSSTPRCDLKDFKSLLSISKDTVTGYRRKRKTSNLNVTLINLLFSRQGCFIISVLITDKKLAFVFSLLAVFV